MELEQHQLSASFPAMSNDEFVSLCENIQTIGLLNPIVLFEGKIIDGWHRYCACQDTGTAIKTINLPDSTDPQVFVISQNKERRHLTKSQIATAAIKVYEWLKDGVNSGFQAASAPSAEPKSSKEIAILAGVSTKTVDEAKKVEIKATPEVKSAVARGELSVSAAVKQMAKPKQPIDEPPIYSEIDRLKDENSELKEIIEGLQYDISIAAYDGAEPIAEIIRELRIAKASLKQVTISRNSLQNELNAAKKQIIAQRKALDLLK